MFDKKAVFWNTATQIVVRVATLAFTLISVKLLTNYLGKDGYGEYGAITAYLNFFVLIADMGLFTTAVREISKHPSDEKKILSNVFYIRLISTISVTIIAILLITCGHFFLSEKYHITTQLTYGIIVASGFLIFNLLWSMFDMIFQPRLKMQYSATSEFIGKLISIAALILVILLRGNFYWVVFTISLSAIATFLLKWFFAHRFATFSLKHDKDTINWLLRISIPFGIVFILNGLYFKLDTMMLYPMKGQEAVGIYTVAYKILEVIAFFGAYFASSLKPTISQNIEKNKEHVKNVIEKSLSIMLLTSLPLTVICVAFSKEIVLFLSNASFLDASSAQMILAFTLPFIYFDVLLAEVLIAADRRKLLLKISALVLAFNFIFNLVFIPRYSFMGAAWGTLISEALLFFIYYIYTKKIISYKINFLQFGKIILLCLLSYLFAISSKATNLNFIILITLTFLVMVLLAYSLQIIKPETIKELFKPKENLE
jgi:O-antigen/teichoic acid export membrane protein